MPRARSTDPQTSHDAAASVTDLTAKQQATLAAMHAIGPVTDFELHELYDLHHAARGWPMQSPSGLRTRRSELVTRGLVEDSGDRAPLPSGRCAILWDVTDAGFRRAAESVPA